jgi:Flp pilus assembly protein TadD
MNDTTAMLDSATAHFRQGDLAKAEKVLSDILASDDNDTDALSLLAKVKLNAGDQSSAALTYQRLLELDPGSEDAVVNLVNHYSVRKEFDRCEQILRDAIEQAPDKTRFYFMLANLLVQNGYHWQAIDKMQRAIALAPKNLQVKVVLAEIYARHGDLDQALDVLQPLLEAPSPHFPAFVVFSNICLALNMREDCIRLIARLEAQHLPPKQHQKLAQIKNTLERTQL